MVGVAADCAAAAEGGKRGDEPEDGALISSTYLLKEDRHRRGGDEGVR